MYKNILIYIFLYTRNLYNSHLEIFIFIYSVRGEIDQLSTNAFRYTMCCAPNVYMFVYTKILEVNLFAFAYRLFGRDFSPLDRTYCMGTHSFLQLYMYFVLTWEGFTNG